MKKNIFYTLLVLLTLLAYLPSYSQSGWFSQNSSTSNSFYDVFSQNGIANSTVHAVGWYGTYAKSTNGGTNWSVQILNPNFAFTCVYFINGMTGWITGSPHSGYLSNILLKTTDGGNNWFTQTPSVPYTLWYVRFLNANTGYICGHYNTICKTTDGGNNWVTQMINTSNVAEFYKIKFFDVNTGWISGSHGKLVKTTNGGQNWEFVNLGTPQYFRGMYFSSINTGWLFCSAGLIFKTTNGGNQWLTQNSGTSNYLFSGSFINSNTGWVAGWNGTILNTTNGGNNWITQQTNTIKDLNAICFIGGLTGWAVGNNGTILKTTNGGYSIPVAPVLLSPPNNSLDISLTPTITWNSSSGATRYKVQISTNPVFSSITDSATVLNTSYTVPNGKLLPAVTYFWRVNASNISGTSPWSEIWNFATITGLSAPVLLSPPNFATNVSQTPLLDWQNVTGATYYKVQISTVSNFSVITDSATVAISQYQVPTGKLLLNYTYFWRVNASNLSGTSQWSYVWRFSVSPSGISNLSSEIPGEFNLYNNYPNPFNPETIIEFDIPTSTDVAIIIYDGLGREVKTLVNQVLVPGKYEINWNATGHSSGIYFYRIITEKYSATKKMLLIR